MKHSLAPIVLFLGLLGFASGPDANAHTIHYRVAEKGIAVRLFYAANDPASYSPYEVFGPEDREPHQTGRTDKHGFLSFLPDRAGRWKVKVWGESTHGFHGSTIDVQVDRALNLESFSQPMVATHIKLITGISLIFGAFGLYALFLARRKSAP